jgi:hypothetical protein
MTRDDRDDDVGLREGGPSPGAETFYWLYILGMFAFLFVIWLKQP